MDKVVRRSLVQLAAQLPLPQWILGPHAALWSHCLWQLFDVRRRPTYPP